MGAAIELLDQQVAQRGIRRDLFIERVDPLAEQRFKHRKVPLVQHGFDLPER